MTEKIIKLWVSERNFGELIRNIITMFVRLPLSSAQGFIGIEKNPSAGLIQNCADDKLSQSYEETVSFCGLLIKDINVCLDITEIELRSDIGDNFLFFRCTLPKQIFCTTFSESNFWSHS